MKLQEITQKLGLLAPESYQESYDNSGLLIGNPDMEITGALVCLDVNEQVLDEAISEKLNLIVSHHPLIFKGLKRLTGKNLNEKLVIKAIQNNLAIYAMHTNLDNVSGGVNSKIADKLNLKHTRVLRPMGSDLRKLCVFCPDMKLSDGQYVPGMVRNALFKAGAGHIGNYDSCSFNQEGLGTYRALEGANPFLGQEGTLNVQKEIRLETVFPAHLQNQIIQAMLEVHPYEEVAYDIYPLKNDNQLAGAGIIGDTGYKWDETEFLEFLKETFGCQRIRYAGKKGKKISKVAVCGGSGSFLIEDAIRQKADIFISADLKYHDFFDAAPRMMLADIGHFESEQFTIDVIHDFISDFFPNFAVSKTKVITNPINYL